MLSISLKLNFIFCLINLYINQFHVYIEFQWICFSFSYLSFVCVCVCKKRTIQKETQITKRQNPCLPAYIGLKTEEYSRIPLFLHFLSLSLLRNPLRYVCYEDNRHVIYEKKETAHCFEGLRVIFTSGWKSRKFARRKLTFTKTVSPCVTFHPSDVDI